MTGLTPPETVLWSAATAAEATGGKSVVDWEALGVSIDSRTLQSEIFLLRFRDRTLTVMTTLRGHWAARTQFVTRRPMGTRGHSAVIGARRYYDRAESGSVSMDGSAHKPGLSQ